MSDPQDDPATPIPPVNTDQLVRIGADGIWAAGPSVDPEAANVGEALVAALQDAEQRRALTADLQRLVTDVQGIATVGFPRITAADGIKLSAFSIRLRTDEPRPVVVIPSGWTPLGWVLFAYAYLQLAKRGYHVLAYTPRGIGLTVRGLTGNGSGSDGSGGDGYIDAPWTSQGTIDVAGPNDWSDGSTMIDYAQQLFTPSRVAFLGESYGSGIGQLVAAHDPAGRVDAVVALSTWGNLATALLANGTRHLAAVNALIEFTGGPAERKFDPATRQILRDFQNGENLDEVRAWATERAPESYLGPTNARGIPTFFSNTWHETLFPVNQVLDTFNALTVPKHLNLWIGDHAAPEGAALTVPCSGPNLALDEAFAWLDHHLLGAANDVPAWPAVSSQVMFFPTVREGRPSWPELTTGTDRLYLAGPAPGGQDGGLGPSPASGWTASFTTGNLTEATAVDAILTTGQAEWRDEPKIYEIGKFDRRYLAAWTSSPGPRRIRGIPRVRLTVAGAGNAATLVAYLFDLAPDGTATIITHEPYTLTADTADTPSGTESDTPSDAAASAGTDTQDAAAGLPATTVAWRLQAAAYDVAAENRLMLVVSSRDQLYSDANPSFSTLQISSAAGDESCLELPLG